MRETIKKPGFRFLIFGLLLGMVMNLGVSFAAEEKPFDVNSFYDESMTLENLIFTYHDEMNKLFNRTIKELISVLSKNRDLKNEEKRNAVLERLEAPEENKEYETCFADAGNMNLSTFCLAVRADDLYENYITALRFQRYKPQPVEENAKQADVQANFAVRNGMIDEELGSAQRAFNATLSAYLELQTAFPLHMQLEQTKDLLIRYRDRLVEVRKQVDEFPKRFINATTTSCK